MGFSEDAYNQGHSSIWFWIILFGAVILYQFIHRNGNDGRPDNED